MKYLLIILILLVTILGYGVLVKKNGSEKTPDSLPIIDSKNTNSVPNNPDNLDKVNTSFHNQIDNKTEESVVSFTAKVISLPDKCGGCPADAICEPCKIVLNVKVETGEEIQIDPGESVNFDSFPFLEYGKS